MIFQLCIGKPSHESINTIRRRRIVLVTASFVFAALHFINQTDTTRIQQTSIHKQTISTTFYPRIPINRETQLAPDVTSIVHIPNEAKIIVQFHLNRTCLQPQLIGRLSGLFLSKIQWEYQPSTMSSTEQDLFLIGYYNVPSSGTYYIEIIVTMCQQIGMDTDATNVCLVDPAYHRITLDGATIDAELNDKTNRDRFDIGFWYNSVEHPSVIKPLYTRYQPQNCRGSNATLDHCHRHTDITKFQPYDFQWNQPFTLSEHLKDKDGRICFVGASHSRVMMRFAGGLSGAQHIHMVHVDNRYVANLTESKFGDMLKCRNVVIVVGQWDAGRHGGRPTPFPEFKMSLNRTMNELVKPLIDSNISVYFRNMQ